MKLHPSCLLVLLLLAVSARADVTVLQSATPFAVLAGSAVANTGPTVINQDLGLSPGTSITGFPPGAVLGTIDQTNAVALQAQTDNTTAYIALSALAPTGNLTGVDLAGQTLTPGVYKFDSSAGLTGALTLDFQNLSNTAIIFQIGTTLTTGSGSSVSAENLGTNDALYWLVGSSATLGSTTSFEGNILALSSITLITGATITCGRALAQTGAVTLDTNTIDTGCGSGVLANGLTGTSLTITAPGPNGGTQTAVVPEPGTLLLLGTAIVGLVGKARTKRATPRRACSHTHP